MFKVEIIERETEEVRGERMSEYIPTTEEVREGFGEAFVGDGSMVDPDDVRRENKIEFDRWLAEHDRQVAERVWREAYYTGKRDYAGSIMGGSSMSTDNPYGPTGA